MICFSTKAVFGKVISVCGCGKNVSRDKIVDINKVKANFGVAILANHQIGRLTEKG